MITKHTIYVIVGPPSQFIPYSSSNETTQTWYQETQEPVWENVKDNETDDHEINNVRCIIVSHFLKH